MQQNYQTTQFLRLLAMSQIIKQKLGFCPGFNKLASWTPATSPCAVIEIQKCVNKSLREVPQTGGHFLQELWAISKCVSSTPVPIKQENVAHGVCVYVCMCVQWPKHYRKLMRLYEKWLTSHASARTYLCQSPSINT